MRGIIDLLIGAFIAFLPLLFLLLRRRRAAGTPAGTAAGPATDQVPAEEIPPSRVPAGGPVKVVPSRGVPANAGSPPDLETRAEEAAGGPPPASVWDRVNRLSPGRRAIVMAEIISKPLALRDRQPWL